MELKENQNFKIVIMDYSTKEIRIVNDNQIDFYQLEIEFDNDLECYLIDNEYMDSNCHFMVVDELIITI